jgi:hypothetical protein
VLVVEGGMCGWRGMAARVVVGLNSSRLHKLKLPPKVGFFCGQPTIRGLGAKLAR